MLIIALLLLSAPGPDTVTVAVRPDNHAAPLYAACRFEKEFAQRYGLSLRAAEPGFRYDLYDGRQRTIVVRLLPLPADADILAALEAGAADIGLLACEYAQLSVLAGGPVRIIAPLQHRGEMLIAGPGIAARTWTEFLAETGQRPLAVGFIGPEPSAAFALEQALDYAELKHSRREGDTVAVRLVEFDGRAALAAALAAGAVDAAALREPDAGRVELAAGGRLIEVLNELPPDRFANAPGTVIAAAASSIAARGPAIGRFLELMGVATHYANNQTRRTLEATSDWLGHERAAESLSLARIRFSSFPGVSFRDGVWNWYFALRLNHRVPPDLAGFMAPDEWLGLPYDSSLVMPALERAGARIIR